MESEKIKHSLNMFKVRAEVGAMEIRTSSTYTKQ
jgi:hypothetical protein